MCCYRWFVRAHSPVCSTLELHKKSSQFFLWWGKVGGVFGERGGEGGGGGGSVFQEVGVCMGFQRGAGWGLSQPGGKSCWAVWRSGLWCSGTVFLMVGAGRDCGRGGWGPSRCCWFCWSIVQGKCPGWMGEGRWSRWDPTVQVVVQVRSYVMCTPRNLVLLTLSTVELSMVSGGWSVEFLLLKSITTSFVFSTFRDRLLAPHHSASCATSSL